ncbi:DNA helicase rad5 [Sporothrix curviconia]|uniref:DNA helicase rad5 n=1 Tax=Sporothrix curviconia TaxID=1260050 RepID=A0ABP0C488_9PEZI
MDADFQEPPSKRRRFSPDDGGDVDIENSNDGQLNEKENAGLPTPSKRRFFDDAVAIPSLSPPQHAAQPTSSPAALPAANGITNGVNGASTPRQTPNGTSSPSPAPRRPAQSSPVQSAPSAPSVPSTARPRPSTPPPSSPSPASAASFDTETFEAIVGQKVSSGVLRIIQECSGNDMERAVNMYFDGTYKLKMKASSNGRNGNSNSSSSSSSISVRSKASKATASSTATKPSIGNQHMSAKTSPRKSILQNPSAIPERRYIGCFGVDGWATRSGANLLRHGETVRIERQKIELPSIAGTKQKASKLGAAVVVRANSAAAKRVDVIVRFTSMGGTEIGRLSKDAANWVSTLMDQRICRFEGVCVYAPERLRTNDTVFLQLRCYLLRSAFDQKPLKPADNRNTGLFEEKETAEERSLRLRQVALVRLFQEVNLLPTRVNEAAAKRGRQDLLQAAEMAEKREKEAAKDAKDASKQQQASSSPADIMSSQAQNGNGSPNGPDEPEDGQELEQDQLDALYRKAQSFDFSTPQAEPPDTFALTLRPYQKQALHWMLSKEKDESGEDRGESMHPLWEEYAWPLKDVDDKDLPQIPDQASFYVNPYSGDLSLDFPVQDQHCLGGILADEMGLGKTIQMLSLIHSHKSPIAMEAQAQRMQQQQQQQQQKAATDSSSEKPSSRLVSTLRRIRSKLPDVVHAPCTTLVVAPMSLLAQWQSEAENASVEGTLKSMVYYGNEKSSNLQALCSPDQAGTAPDVIITSYGTVLSEFTQMWSKSGGHEGHPGHGLFSLNFFRIILDEAHTIKNRQSKTAKACYALSAEHRWVLTGTPVVNRLEDLFSLIRFLRVEPWNNFSFWRTFITVPFESKDFMRALDVVQTVLEPLVMRRTKDMKTPDGQPLVLLPAKHMEIVPVELSKVEREIYDHIFMRAKRSLTANMEAGTVMKSFTSIFAQVLRLRQVCCHPVLVRNMDIVADEVEAGAAADAAAGLADDMDLQSLVERFTATTDDPTDANAYGAHVLSQIRDEAVNECPICAEEPMIQQTVTGCWHSACKDCLLKFIDHETSNHHLPRCFHCREIINRRDLFEVVRHDDDPETALVPGGAAPRISLQRVDVNESSAKVVRLIQHLRDLRRERPTIKSVVFSQFTSFMSLIEPALQRSNMRFLRLDGTMAQKARTAVLDEFRKADKFTVLLLSLKAGGVGLNLTTAKRVYMMDPWWSFSVEAQAIDRVHRMGQDEEVKVYRFIVKMSVEEKMLKIQDRKKFIATSLGMMNDEEKKLQRVEDIKELLS